MDQNLPGERDVTDVAWRDGHTFASTAADGSLQLWDTRRVCLCSAPHHPGFLPTARSSPRNAQHARPKSTRRRLTAHDDLYCWGQRGVSLLCCAWCPGDSNYVATVAQDSPSVVVLDIRRAGRVGASVLADLALPQVSLGKNA